MNMDRLISIGPNGTVLDTGIGEWLPALMRPPFAYSDIVIYSHGWWESATDAMADYNLFTVGQSLAFLNSGKPMSSLQLGIHWPAMVSEDSNVLTNIRQPFSFFSRASMADDVGEHGVYAILRLILEARELGTQPRVTLIGHSFGCKVVCSALQALADDSQLAPMIESLPVNLVLLQAAFDNDSFESGQDYGLVLSTFSKLKVLATCSNRDFALCAEYPRAQKLRLFNKGKPAMGSSVGPSSTTSLRLNMPTVPVDIGYMPTLLAGQSLCADLSLLHSHDGIVGSTFSGQHSDIFQPEIYRLIAAFVGVQ